MEKANRKLYHPRNFYKNKINFQRLAIKYPEFREIAKQDITGKITIDFKNEEHIRVLNATLLKKDFGLKVYLAPGYLVPTIPLRYNYILWIEDILNFICRKNRIYGIDIGTGASGVYTLLGAKKNKWNMIGTDIDTQSVIYAQENVNANNLDDLVKIILTQDDEPLFTVITNEKHDYDFCMCNPPFYNFDELNKINRTDHRPEPSNAPSGKTNEIITQGGEIQFIGRIINESKELKTKIKVYTTMVGHKKNLFPLIEHLKSVGVKSYCGTKFFQGHVTRWGLAWTYCNFNLTNIPNSNVENSVEDKATNSNTEKGRVLKAKPLYHSIAKKGRLFDEIFNKMKYYFDALEFSYKQLQYYKGWHNFDITAYKNTWTGQRRKKREHIMQRKDQTEKPGTSDQEINESKKRPADSPTEYPDEKRIKFCEEPLINFSLNIREDSDAFKIIMIKTDELNNKDMLNQIMQYFKNNL